MSSTKRRKRAPGADPVWKVDPRRDAELLAEASALTKDYRIVLDASEKGGYIGSSVELPGVIGHGGTADECVRSTRELLTTAAAVLLRAGHRPPPSAKQLRSQGRSRRSDQLNLRVTAEEKQLLEKAARKHGFGSVSEFVRSRALESVSGD